MAKLCIPACSVFILMQLITQGNCFAVDWPEPKLFHKLFDNSSSSDGYNKWLRPVKKNSDVVQVSIKLVVRRLVDVDEKNHMMITSVQLYQIWQDRFLTWDPNDYEGLTSIQVPVEFIWLPEIMLLDNSDGNYTIKHKTNAKIYCNGTVVWKPPAMFKSACSINVKYFPFDTQYCGMKFASLSYDGTLVQLSIYEDHKSEEKISNGEWNIIDTHITYTDHRISTDIVFLHPTIKFSFVLQRLPFFHTVFLIFPCIGISFLTGLVFCLPSESQEKITLCISVLLAHTFYLLVISEMMPASPKTIPLIAEFLLFTLTFITLAILLSTVVLNIHYRSSITHRPLPPSLRKLLFETAPKFLWLTKPVERACCENTLTESNSLFNKVHHGCKFLSFELEKINPGTSLEQKMSDTINTTLYISEQMRKKIQQKQEILEWKFAAAVLDRIFFIIFLLISFCGPFILLLPSWKAGVYY